jgi:hypothetical protein
MWRRKGAIDYVYTYIYEGLALSSTEAKKKISQTSRHLIINVVLRIEIA